MGTGKVFQPVKHSLQHSLKHLDYHFVSMERWASSHKGKATSSLGLSVVILPAYTTNAATGSGVY